MRAGFDGGIGQGGGIDEQTTGFAERSAALHEVVRQLLVDVELTGRLVDAGDARALQGEDLVGLDGRFLRHGAGDRLGSRLHHLAYGRFRCDRRRSRLDNRLATLGVGRGLLRSLEKSGVTIKGADVTGKLIFLVSGHTVEYTVIEKMTRRLTENRTWTAFPGHHQGGLVSTGFLRVTVTTYLRPAIPEWVETPRRKMNDLIPEIVERVLGTPVILDRMAAEHREFLREVAKDSARSEEVARKRHLEKVRFERLGDLADSWRRAQQLSSFIDELERRSGNDRDVSLDGKSLAEWIGWARQRVTGLDPFQHQATDIYRLFVDES